jgi:hypothetical protein
MVTLNRNHYIAGIILIVLVCAALFFRPSSKPSAVTVDSNTIYYKGPMRSRGSTTYGVDNLNPDMVGDDPEKISKKNKK